MLSYAKQIFSIGFLDFHVRTDVWFAAASVAAAGLSSRKDKLVADITTYELARYVLIAVITYGVLRLVFYAPYRIWKQDQATIKRLQNEIDDPKRKRMEAMRASLIEHKVKLASALARIEGDLREKNCAFKNADEFVAGLRDLAGPLLVVPLFKNYWMFFEQNMKHVAALNRHAADNLDMDEATQHKALSRFSVHYMNIEAAISLMGAWLTEGDLSDLKKEWEARLAVYKDLELDFSFAVPDRFNYLEHNLHLIGVSPEQTSTKGTATEKQP